MRAAASRSSAILALLLAASILADAAGLPTVTLEGLLLVVDVDYQGGGDATHYFLRQADYRLWPLNFPNGADALVGVGSGRRIHVEALATPYAAQAAAGQEGERRQQQQGSAATAEDGPTRRRAAAVASGIAGQEAVDAPQAARKLLQAQPQSRQQQAGRLPLGAEGGSYSAIQQQEHIEVLAFVLLPPAVSLSAQPAQQQELQQQRDGGHASRTRSADARSFTYNTDRLMMDDVSAVIFITNMCGNGPAATQEELESVLFDQQGSLGAFFSSCSFGAATFSRLNTLVVGPVDIPCTGTDYWGTPFLATACDKDDYFGWQYYLENWASENQVDLTPYRHRVLLTSPNKEAWMVEGSTDCSWTGLGLVGPETEGALYSPGALSFAWVSGDHWRSPVAWAHELGHNYYMRHAASSACGYCDSTCPMGTCCSTRCFNAPHAWQAGWGSNAGTTLDGATLQRGASTLWALPPAWSSAGAWLRILPTWTLDTPPDAGGGGWPQTYNYLPATLWLSYRQYREPYEALLPYDASMQLDGISPSDVHDYVHVYQYSGTDPTDASATQRIGTLGPGAYWRDWVFGTGLVVAWDDLPPAAPATQAVARLRLCIATSPWDGEDDCGDGLDGDCDGFSDAEDPDCILAATAWQPPDPAPGAPPPSLPPSPPPPASPEPSSNAAYAVYSVVTPLEEPRQAVATPLVTDSVTSIGSGGGGEGQRTLSQDQPPSPPLAPPQPPTPPEPPPSPPEPPALPPPPPRPPRPSPPPLAPPQPPSPPEPPPSPPEPPPPPRPPRPSPPPPPPPSPDAGGMPSPPYSSSSSPLPPYSSSSSPLPPPSLPPATTLTLSTTQPSSTIPLGSGPGDASSYSPSPSPGGSVTRSSGSNSSSAGRSSGEVLIPSGLLPLGKGAKPPPRPPPRHLPPRPPPRHLPPRPPPHSLPRPPPLPSSPHPPPRPPPRPRPRPPPHPPRPPPRDGQ